MTVSVRESLNGAIQGRMEPAAQRASFGDLLNEAIKALANRVERVGVFRQDNVAAGQAGVALTLNAVDANAPTSIVAPRAGRIVGVTARSNADLTAGTAQFAATINGVAQAEIATLSDLVQQQVKRFNTPVAFVEGDLLGVKITTDGALAPATAEMFSDLVIEWGSDSLVVQDGLAPASNVVTLATKPVSVLDVFVNAGTSTGHKKLRVAPLTGLQAVTPAAGEAVWDGNLSIKLAAADAATSVRVTAVRSTDQVASIMQADVDQR